MSINFIHLVAFTLTRAITTVSTMELPLLLLGFHAAQADAENALQLNELTSWPSCLYFPSAGITGVQLLFIPTTQSR